MTRALTSLAALFLLFSAACMPRITGGPLGRFYSLPESMPGVVTSQMTPGNDHSYVEQNTVLLPNRWTIYRDGLVTNVTPPRLTHDGDTDTFSYSFDDSVLLRESNVTDAFTVYKNGIRDLSWMGFNYYEGYHNYYAVGSNFVDHLFSTPRYRVKPLRQDQTTMAAMAAAFEATSERLHYASLGTNAAPVTAVSNHLFWTRRMYDPSIAFSTNVVSWGDMMRTDWSGLIGLTGGIATATHSPKFLNNGPCHWWSSSLFDGIDATYKLLPVFDWSKIDAHTDEFMNSAVCFYNFNNEGETPIKKLIEEGATADYPYHHASFSVPAYERPAEFPNFLTNWFEKAFQSRGVYYMNEDVDECFSDNLSYRKLPMFLCGVNQGLAIMDRTIHIPVVKKRCNGYELTVTRTKTWEANGSCSIYWAGDEWAIDSYNVSWSQSFQTNQLSYLEKKEDEIFLDVGKTSTSCSASVRATYSGCGYFDLGREEVIGKLGRDMEGRDPSLVHFIPYDITCELNGNIITYTISIGKFDQSVTAHTTLDIDDVRMDVGGSATCISSYECNFPTNVTIMLGPTQPGVGAVQRSNARKVGTLSEVSWYQTSYNVGYTPNHANHNDLFKTTHYSYSDRASLITYLNSIGMQTLNKVIDVCPVSPLAYESNAPLVDPYSFADIQGVEVHIAGGDAGFFRVEDWGTDDVRIYLVRNENDTYGEMLSAQIGGVRVEVVFKIGINQPSGGLQNYFHGRGNFQPITQVDWSWQNMHLERNENQ